MNHPVGFYLWKEPAYSFAYKYSLYDQFYTKTVQQS